MPTGIGTFRYQDPTAAKNAMYTQEGQIQCGMGLTDSKMCKMTPQSAQCDQLMMHYCQTTGQNDPRCACVNSEMDCPNKFDKKCIQNNAYRTADMARTPCPNVMNCTQFVSLSPGAQAIATNVDQNCASAQKTGATSTTPPIPAAMPASTSTSSHMLLWVFLLIFIFVIIIGVIIYVFSGDDAEATS
jgi:hypothetical protein